MCVESKTVRPSLAYRDSRPRNRTRSSGSSPAVGSSTTRIGGLPISACAMPTLRFMPPESCPILRRENSSISTSSSTALTAFLSRIPLICAM